MNQFLQEGLLGQEMLWGVEAWRLVVALVLVFLGFLSRRIIRWLFTGFLKNRVGQTRVQWDDDLVELVPKPMALVVQVVLWFAVAFVLQLPEEPANIRRFVINGLMAALAVAVTWVAFRLLDVLALAAQRASEKTETRLDDQVIPLLRKTIKVFLAVIVAVVVVDKMGYSVASLLASLGIGGLALALAAKDTVANFFGSVVVFTDQPFHVGDWVEFDDVEGIVEEVGMRTTRVRRFDKSLATVPNQTFTNTTIVNHSKRPMRRIRLTLGLGYETTPAQMQALLERIRALLAGMPALDPELNLVYFTELGDSSLNVFIQGFTQSPGFIEYMETQEALLLDLMRIVSELGLEIAFPTRTVYFRDEQWKAPLASSSSEPEEGPPAL